MGVPGAAGVPVMGAPGDNDDDGKCSCRSLMAHSLVPVSHSHRILLATAAVSDEDELEEDETGTQVSESEARANFAYSILKKVGGEASIYAERERSLVKWLKSTDDAPRYDPKDLQDDDLLDPDHQLRCKHAALILHMLMYEWHHLVPSSKDQDVSRIHKHTERRHEATEKCVVLCLVCHFAETLRNGDSARGKGKDPKFEWSESQQKNLLRHLHHKDLRHKKQGAICCGTPHRPGRPAVCLHRPAMERWLGNFEAVWARDRSLWEKTGLLSPRMFFLRIMTQWDHINKLLKNRKVSEISNPIALIRELRVCQLLCPFCHEIKTYFNRDMVSWSHVPHALVPYRDGTVASSDPNEPDEEGNKAKPDEKDDKAKGDRRKRQRLEKTRWGKSKKGTEEWGKLKWPERESEGDGDDDAPDSKPKAQDS
jgi:hypothetical protein